MRELFSEWIEPFKEFRFSVREKGIFIAFFHLLMYLLFTLLCLPFLFFSLPLAFINEKSKEIFK